MPYLSAYFYDTTIVPNPHYNDLSVQESRKSKIFKFKDFSVIEFVTHFAY